MVTVHAVRDGEHYTLAVPHVGTQVVVINGQAVAGGTYAEPALVTVRGVPKVELWAPLQVLTGYRSMVDGRPDLDVDTWETEAARLKLRGTADDDGGLAFLELEDEVAWTRLQRSYQAHYRTVLALADDVTVTVHDKVPEEPFMVPKRMLGGDYMSSLVAYDRPGFMLDWLRRRLERAGMAERSGLAALDRHGYKVFHLSGEISLHLPGAFHRKVPAHVVTETWGKVREMRDRDIATMEGWVSGWFADIATPVNAMEVGEDLRALRDSVVRLQAKAASEPGKRDALRRIDMLLQKVSAAGDGAARAA